MSKLSVLMPIIVALIGIIGTITPFYMDKITSQNENKPNIDIDVDGMDYKKIIDVSNNGNGLATNMSLFLNASPLYHF